MAIFTAPNGLQVRLISRSGDVYETLSDTDLSGQVLNARINAKKIGGIESFSFNIPRNKDIPITRNHKVEFNIDGETWYTGYVTDVPTPDQNSSIINVVGKGYYSRLGEITINTNYAAQTLADIIADIGTNYLGATADVTYDATKINAPTISNITIEFSDRSLFDVFDTLVSIANYQYATRKYYVYVDNNQDLVFDQLPTIVLRNIYEGYHFQRPIATNDVSRIINKILAFRTTTGDTDTVEYVATYSDVNSQNENGVFEEKMTFPDYVDTTTIQNIANSVLARRKNPQPTIQIQELDLSKLYGDETYTELLWHGQAQSIRAPVYGRDDDIYASTLWAAFDFDDAKIATVVSTIENLTRANRAISVTGSPVYAEGESGYHSLGIDFDGTNDYIIVQDTSFPVTTGDFGVAMWASFDNALIASNEKLIDYRSLVAVEGFVIEREAAAEKIQFLVPNGFGGWHILVSDSAVTNDGYHHIVCTREAGVLKMYIDSVLQAVTGASVITIGAHNPSIGALFDGTLKLDGKLSKLRIYNIGITQNDVDELYNNPIRTRYNYDTDLQSVFTYHERIERGECESTVPPMVIGESVPVVSNAAWERSEDEAYTGRHSYRFMKTVATGTAAYTQFVDSISSTDMHGYIADDEVILRIKVKIPTLSGILGTEIALEYWVDDGGGYAIFETLSAQNVYDEWQTLEISSVVDPMTVGMYLRLTAKSTAAINEYFYVDVVTSVSSDNTLFQPLSGNKYWTLLNEVGYGYQSHYSFNLSESNTELQGLSPGDVLHFEAWLYRTRPLYATMPTAMVENGDCESLDPPITVGGGINYTNRVTFARDGLQKDTGTYSYRIEAVAGAGAYDVSLMTAVDYDSMYAYRPGDVFVLTMRVRVPIGLGVTLTVTATEGVAGSATPALGTATNVGYDAWETLTVAGTISTDASGFNILFTLGGTVNIGDYVNVDNIVVTRDAPGPLYTEIALVNRQYVAAAWVEDKAYLTAESEWSKVEQDITIADTATAIHFWLLIDYTANGGEYRVQNVSLKKKAYKPIVTPDANMQNLIKYGDCENEDRGPALHGEGDNTLVNVNLWGRVSASFKFGAYSRAHLTDSITESRVYFHTGITTTDMHGFVIGDTYLVSAWLNSNGMSLGTGDIIVEYYNGAAWVTALDLTTISNINDWKNVSGQFAFPSTATGMRMYSLLSATVPAMAGWLIDNIGVYNMSRKYATHPIGFGDYLIHNRLDDYWVLGAPCNTDVGWDTAGLANTTLSISSTRNLTNRRVLKLDTVSGSLDEYLEYSLSTPVPLPVAIRTFLYFETTAVSIEITFYDDARSTSFTVLYNSYDSMLKVTDNVTPITTTMEVTDAVPVTDDLRVSFTTTVTKDQWIQLERDIVPAIEHVDRIRITLKTDAIATLYIDRIDVKSSQYKNETLQLEEVQYNLSSIGRTADLSFGEPLDNLEDAINVKIARSDVARKILSKQ